MHISDRCSLENVERELSDFLEYLDEKLTKLLSHDFISKSQSAFLKTTKDNLKPNEFVVISDFAENFTFVIQQEVQAYHWTNEQCTLHPFAIYYKDGNELKMASLVIVAESLEHNVTSVYLFQTKLFEFLQNKFGNIEKIYFFSDGAASQYKNKKNFLNVCEMEEKHGFKAEWHFFATSHGKSPCDALGGTIKRMATRESLRRVIDGHIRTAKELFAFLQRTDTVINTILCTQEEHDAMARKLEHKYDNIRTITGTQKFHAFIPAEGTHSLNCKRISSSESQTYVEL